jgi:Flp pilus assembly protein TadB
VILALGIAWGALAAGLCARLAGRVQTTTRLRRPKRRHRHRRARRRASARRHADAIAREITAAVDLLSVATAAGCTPFVAVEYAREWAPLHLAHAFDEVHDACAVGATFDNALVQAATHEPGIRPLTDVLRQSTRLGAPVAPALSRLGAELRADLRRRAETRARTVPVRLCFPLVGCILPAFALLTVAPVILSGLHQ